MLIAGHETTAQSLAFGMYELLKKPEYESMLKDEVDNFGRNREVTNDDLKKVFN